MDIAHFRIEKGKKIIYQSVEAHLNGTANLAEGFASKINMPKADCWDYYMTAGNLARTSNIFRNAYNMNLATGKRLR